MKSLLLEIFTPQKKVFSGEVLSVTFPGEKGNFQVLFNHAPLISSLEIGAVKIAYLDGTKRIFATSGGFVEVKNNRVVAILNTFESQEEIDVKRAEAAAERARQRLYKHSADIDLIRAEAALIRAINRIKIKNYHF
jgi:F-type H+-transporting ATPase subunit epsilon